MSAVTQFNLEYVTSVTLGLLAGYLVHSAMPESNAIIKFFIVPLTVAYIMVNVINIVFPQLNQVGYRLKTYGEARVGGEIDSLGYMQVFPPMFAVFVLFLILLYNRTLN